MFDRGSRVEVARNDTPVLVFDATGVTGNCDGSFVSVTLDAEHGGGIDLYPVGRVRLI